MSMNFLVEKTPNWKDSLIFKMSFLEAERFNKSVLNTKNNSKWKVAENNDIPYIPPGLVEVDIYIYIYIYIERERERERERESKKGKGKKREREKQGEGK